MRKIFFMELLLCLLFSLQSAAAAENSPERERRDYTMGTGNNGNGYAGTWTDPESGDKMTTVIAPRQKTQEQGQYPIYVYPQIAPTWPNNPDARPYPPSRPPQTGPQPPYPPQPGPFPPTPYKGR